MTEEEKVEVKISAYNTLKVLVQTLKKSNDDRDNLNYIVTVVDKQYTVTAMRDVNEGWTVVKINPME